MPDVQSMINSTFGMIAVIFIATLVLSIVIIFWVRRMVMPNRQLLTTGEPAQAKILRFWDTGMTVNDNPMVGFLLEVYPANRTPYQVETKAMISRLSIGGLQQGAMVAVRVDPVDQRKIVFSPM
jgi:hypothetical protein